MAVWNHVLSLGVIRLRSPLAVSSVLAKAAVAAKLCQPAHVMSNAWCLVVCGSCSIACPCSWAMKFSLLYRSQKSRTHSHVLRVWRPAWVTRPSLPVPSVTTLVAAIIWWGLSHLPLRYPWAQAAWLGTRFTCNGQALRLRDLARLISVFGVIVDIGATVDAILNVSKRGL